MLAFFASTAPIVGPANAYTFTEVIDPKDAVLNDETKGSDDVKAGIASLKEFQSTIKGLKSDLVSYVKIRRLHSMHTVIASTVLPNIRFFDQMSGQRFPGRAERPD
jgi:hypothetical protein